MKVLYTRVSSITQNEDRQLQDQEKYDYVFIDKCSGSIPLFDRPKGSQLLKLIEKNQLNYLVVHSIDRLGRNTIDVLNTWKFLTELKIVILCKNPTLSNFDENGKVNIFSEFMISILSTMSSFEKDIIKERQAEGIKIAKAKGLYAGRIINSKESEQKFLSKHRTKKIILYLSEGYTQQEITKILGCSYSTIKKVKDYLK